MAKKEPVEKRNVAFSEEEANRFKSFFTILMNVDKREKAKRAAKRENQKVKIRGEESGLAFKASLIFSLSISHSMLSKQIRLEH